MPRNAVYYPLTSADHTSELKRLLLFFDKIYINSKDLSRKPGSALQDVKALEDLQKQGLVIGYFSQAAIDEEKIKWNEAVFPGTISNKIPAEWLENLDRNYKHRGKPYSISTLNDIFTRIDAVDLSGNIKEDFFPVLWSDESYEGLGRKKQVVKFILDDIPVPDTSVSIERIIDFRNDRRIHNKYLAIIHWLNKKAASDDPIKDIEDEYRYLYSDFVNQLELLKTKSQFSRIEIWVTAGVAFLEALAHGGLVTFGKSILRGGISTITLMQEEEKLPGKDLSYVFKTKEMLGVS